MSLDALDALLTRTSGLTLEAGVERAMLRAWPALNEQVLDGCLLRFSEGYTRRANCATAYAPGAAALDERIAEIEALYHTRSLPAIFRLASPWACSELDDALERRGYLLADVTRVLALDLCNWTALACPQQLWQAANASDWLDAYQSIAQAPVSQRAPHLRILGATQGTAIPICAGSPSNPMGCGLGILEGRYVGLFNIAVRADARRQGWGSALVTKLLRKGQALGAEWAYLQVTDANQDAVRLYRALGFCDIYYYWYRESPETSV